MEAQRRRHTNALLLLVFIQIISTIIAEVDPINRISQNQIYSTANGKPSLTGYTNILDSKEANELRSFTGGDQDLNPNGGIDSYVKESYETAPGMVSDEDGSMQSEREFEYVEPRLHDILVGSEADDELMEKYSEMMKRRPMEFRNDFGKRLMEFRNDFGKRLLEFRNDFGKRRMEFRNDFGKRRMEFRNDFGKRSNQFQNDLEKRPMEFRNDFGKRAMEFRNDFGKRKMEFRNDFGK